ncbi:hypothetical protein PGT21_007090 [Puccinia graminis f. sp. tritici]|uniref:Uncharacterized protein n=1 Tax=Puccinia graminis f. sp. tritici TaxID=56615 RepID=A0A5B0QI32_PUCGR|nr:hypothetical protein PGT21_007090 [Puccinia graminis f. sp. tritici]
MPDIEGTGSSIPPHTLTGQTTSSEASRRTQNSEDESDVACDTMGTAKNKNPIGHRDRLSDSEMQLFANMNLAQLRVAAASCTTRGQMTQDMIEEVNDLYYEFQCKVVRLAIQNRVGEHLYFGAIGQSRKIRGASTWNNFFQYDPQALKLFDEFGRRLGGRKASELWNTKTQEEKDHYSDMDFLNSLREVIVNSSSTSVPPNSSNQEESNPPEHGPQNAN